MSESIYSAIGEKLHISRATVCRALRHCGEVDGETRLSVLEEAAKLSFQPVRQGDVYVILPETPSYFWGDLYRAFTQEEQAGSPFSYHLYSRIGDSTTLLHYLKEAETVGARVIIVAAAMTDGVEKELTRLSASRAVFLVSEYGEAVNTFFFGADPTADGYALGTRIAQEESDGILVLSASWHRPASLRTAGCLQALSERGRAVKQIPLAQEVLANPKTTPAKLAALLVTAAKEGGTQAVYLPFGVPRFELALTKANLRGKVRCFCHDTEPSELYTAVCRQDLTAQAKAAMQAATVYLASGTYPSRKSTVIPSFIL